MASAVAAMVAATIGTLIYVRTSSPVGASSANKGRHSTVTPTILTSSTIPTELVTTLGTQGITLQPLAAAPSGSISEAAAASDAVAFRFTAGAVILAEQLMTVTADATNGATVPAWVVSLDPPGGVHPVPSKPAVDAGPPPVEAYNYAIVIVDAGTGRVIEEADGLDSSLPAMPVVLPG
jgi:hypothetical protein